jgi:lysozyme family protein
MSSLDTLILEIIEREGRKDTNNPNDSGGRTKYGISERAHPEAWKNGPPTLEEAKDIYFVAYLVKPNIHRVTPNYLRDQVADWAVTSGPMIAIQNLQRILKVKDDGVLGPITLAALATRNGEDVNNRLVDGHVLMIGRLVQRRPKDLEFLFGWLRRALSFRRF